MSKIAIKGHPTRGKEVIELLEMLGGVDWHGFAGNRLDSAYYISDSKAILFDDTYDIVFEDGIKEFITFTLEEFLEKFPYKVCDKVNSPCKGCIKTITSMEWDTCRNTVTYKLDNRIYTNIDQLNVFNDLQPYKEETNMKINKCTKCVYAVNNNHCGLRGFRSNFNVNYCSAQNVDKLPNGFELQEDGYFSWVNKKPKYPSTYLECCSILQINNRFSLTYNNVDNKYITSYEYQLMLDMEKLRKLKVCRDAYWKIAGEEMGLGKPWEPDYTNPDIDLYVIINVHNNIEKAKYGYGFQNCVLSFPTVEIRDAFYENFKVLIECCKEYL